MDPLSVTASIIAVLQLTASVVSYLSDLKNATKDQARCIIETSNILSLLTSLRFRLEDANEDDPWYTAIRALAVENGPLEQYKAAIERLVSKTTSQDGVGKVRKILLWKFNKQEVAEIFSKVERLKSLTQIALEMDHFKLARAIKDETQHVTREVQTIRRRQDDQQFQAIIDWLSPLDFADQQRDFSDQRQNDTGTWFIGSEAFLDWLNGSKPILFCPGIPGAGKTMISSLAIDRLMQAYQDRKTGIAYLYCNYKKYQEQKAINLFSALLKQLAQTSLTPEPVRVLYEQHQQRQTRPSIDEILKTLHAVIQNHTQVFIVVDALDECQEGPEYRDALLVGLRSLLAPQTRLMVTSRPIPKITQEFQNSSILEIRAREDDVRLFVESQTARLPACVLRNQNLKQLIITKITDHVEGMFLLARLHLDSLAGETTAKSIKYTLKTLKSGARSLPQAYEDAVKRIESQSPSRVSLAKEVLSWIIIAKRPLTLRELQHALAIEIGETELDEDNIPDVTEIISVCAGLVAIDKQSDIIRLVHYTTQEFFEHIEKAWIPQARSMVVNKCVTYLSFDTFLARPAKSFQFVPPMLAENPFLNYAASHWGMHAFQLYSEEKSNAIAETHELALRFLQNESLVQSSSLVLAKVYSERFPKFVPVKGTGLHMAAFFGLAHLSASLLEQQDDTRVEPDSGDMLERTPLSYAAERGHMAVVKLLLGRLGVDINRTDIRGNGPLSYAAMKRHVAIVQLMLAKDEVHANSKNGWGGTPLLYAVRRGDVAIVKLLLERADVDINHTDIRGNGPLLYAAMNGHATIVQLMLAKDGVDVNSKNQLGGTPLLYAAGRGNVAVVKLLLERADIDVSCKRDIGPASHIWYEREAMAKTLPERPDVDAEFRDWYRLPPFRHEEIGRYKEIIKLLKDHIASH